MHPPETPVLVGAAQLTQRWQPPAKQRDPLHLMIDVSREAMRDAGASLLSKTIDAVYVVNTITWSYDDTPAMVSRGLELSPSYLEYTAIGGNTPQFLVNRAARALEEGRYRTVLLVGAEAGYSARKAAQLGVDLGWPPMKPPRRITGDSRMGSSQLEFAYDLTVPAFIYPLFETALRAHQGRNPRDHRQHLGLLCERLSKVAAQNPYAWFPRARSAAEISTPTPENRYIGYPYTKLMNAILQVDQAAAILLTTEAEADRMGIDPARWVYPMGGAHLNDVWYLSQRPHLDQSPAMQKAAQLALEQAGLSLRDIDAFDLYSCFPCAVQIACRNLGIAIDDPRGLTITGGLPYFGGPGNNYSMHAIVTAVHRIRDDPSLRVMVSALGWYLTKHAVGIYGATPPDKPWREQSFEDEQARIDVTALKEPIERGDGRLEVEAFVIRHRRDGSPRRGVVLGRLEGQRRTLAFLDLPPTELERLEEQELVGTTGRCHYDTSTEHNLFRPGYP